MKKGIYSLIIKLNKDQGIKIGKLGKINFKKGFYIYTGSALNDLNTRIERHRKKQKKKFWHIDYFLANRYVKILQVIAIKTEKKLECKLNKVISSLPNAKIVEGFGCSDCECKTHLLYFDEVGVVKSLFKFNKHLY